MSEPQHIKEIVPGVMSEIERRRRGVLAAVAGFDQGHQRPKKRTRASQSAKSWAKQARRPATEKRRL
jgi:hypothetical protein